MIPCRTSYGYLGPEAFGAQSYSEGGPLDISTYGSDDPEDPLRWVRTASDGVPPPPGEAA